LTGKRPKCLINKKYLIEVKGNKKKITTYLDDSSGKRLSLEDGGEEGRQFYANICSFVNDIVGFYFIIIH